MYGRRIVVGADGTVGSALAVSWAVDECRLRAAVLLIAHCPDMLDARAAVQYGEAGLRAIDRRADQLLASFAQAASDRQPTVPVSSLLSHSDASNALVDLSANSELVVLGSHGYGLPEHGVGRLIAARAHCPVLVVPNAFRMDSMSLVPCIVHVVTGDPVDEVAGRFAEQEALLRNVPMWTAHWSKPEELHARSGGLFVVGRRSTDDRWSERLDAAPAHLLSRLPGPVAVVSDPADRPVGIGLPTLSASRP
jgi:nucleotide-binding universal stress UspA family protein